MLAEDSHGPAVYVLTAVTLPGRAKMPLEHTTGRAPSGRPSRSRPSRAAPSPEGRIGPWPTLLRYSEVAFELGLSVRRIYQLVDEGRLEAVKIDKSARITTASMLK